eukprot:12417251-Karenia_brevis.AAC.1
METNNDELDICTLKIKHRFAEDLHTACQDGTLTVKLRSLITMLRVYPYSDVWDLEGFNGTLKSCISRCPNIGLPLVAGRCEMRKELGIGGRKFVRKWSKIAPRAHAVMQACTQYYKEGIHLSEESNRWTDAIPTAQHKIPSEKMVKYAYARLMPAVRLTQEAKWATQFHMDLHKAMPTVSASWAFAFCNPKNLLASHKDLYCFMDKNYAQGIAMPLSVHHEPIVPSGANEVIAKVRIPLCFHDVHPMIQKFYDACQNGLSRVQISVYQLRWHCTPLAGRFAKVRGGRCVSVLRHVVRKPKVTQQNLESSLDMVPSTNALSADHSNNLEPTADEDVHGNTMESMDDLDIDEELLEELSEQLAGYSVPDGEDELESMYEDLLSKDVEETGADYVEYHEELEVGIHPDEAITEPSGTDALLKEAVHAANNDTVNCIPMPTASFDLAADAPSSDSDVGGADSDAHGSALISVYTIDRAMCGNLSESMQLRIREQHQSLFDEWRAQSTRGAQILLQRFANIDVPPGRSYPTSRGGVEMSLVAFKNDTPGLTAPRTIVSYVHWKDVGSLRGYLVKLDDDGSMEPVWPTPVSHELIDLTGCTFVHKAIGSRAIKRSAQSGKRQPVDKDIDHLKKMWSAAISTSARLPSSTSACAACCQHVDMPLTCCLCMNTFHFHCSAVLAQVFQDNIADTPIPDTISAAFPAEFYPDGHDDTSGETWPLCRLCSQWLQIGSNAMEDEAISEQDRT